MADSGEVGHDDIWSCASQAALQRTTDLARRVLKAPISLLSSFAGDEQVLRSTYGFEHLAPPLSLSGNVCRRVVDGGHPLVVADIAKDFSGATVPDGVVAYLGAPLRLSDGRDIGTLCVMDLQIHEWSKDDVELICELAAFLANQIELKLEAVLREKTEVALGASKARLLAVADHMPGLVFERRKIDAGRSSYTFFGSSKTTLPAVRTMMEGGASGSLNFIHRDDRDVVRAAILRSNIEETDLDLTFRVKDFDGKLRWIRSQSIVRRDADGTVCWDGLCFDISDLAAAREGAEAARVAKDDPVIGINDQLRAPLQAIIGSAEFLKPDTAPDLVATYVRNIQTAAETMLGLINGPSTQDGIDELVSVASEGPVGAVPATADKVDWANENIASPDGHSAETRILLADDLDLNRKLIADMLGTDGHVVDCVADGAEAVRAAAERRYDVILMDMIMPGMDGIAATREIRKLPAPACDVPILALTAHSFKDQLESCLTAGMNATLTKPMSLEALTSAVSSWTRKRKAA